MKRISLVWVLVCLFVATASMRAQQQCDIPLMAFIPDQVDPLPEGAESYLENKLIQIAVSNGLSAGSDYTQFAILPKITLLTKDILPGPPKTFALNMEVTFYIADYMGEKTFASTTISVKGVGANETKAYMDGIKRISTQNPAFEKLVKDGKEKIVSYYNANYQNIIKKAQSLAGMKQFDEALFYLTAIPSCCVGYNAALTASADIYQKYVDDLCNQNLSKAKMAWAQDQNSRGAGEAGEYLQYIYPDAKCYKEAMVLYKEIKGKVLDDWKFAMKVYNDAVSLEKQRINAWKEVGVAYGRGQKARTTNLIWVR